VTVQAPAKVNVALAIRGRRPDGYHEIDTIMLPVTLSDRLTVRRAVPGRLTLTVRGGPGGLTTGEENTILRAARALRPGPDAPGAVMTLEKRIPVGAGLGGGSSDAAAALVALSGFWRCRVTASRLRRIAAGIGSDVPFFLGRGAARARGRGERLTTIACPKPFHLVLVYPGFESSTRGVYAALRRFRPWSRRRPVRMGKTLRALAAGDPGKLAGALVNDLETPAQAMSPRLAALRTDMERLPFRGVGMSGSGSCYFGICRNAAEARVLADRVRRRRLGQAWAVVAGGPRNRHG
jgi:4-diphosphocytidyl-2-C-methyl-D-erythritol kinase